MTGRPPHVGRPRARASRFVAPVVVAAALTTAACGGGSSGGPAPSASGGPSTVTASGSVPTEPATDASPAPTASVAQPPDPVVETGNQGAWTLTRAAPGASASQQVPTLECQAGGIVAAPKLYLYPGGTDLSLVGDTPEQTVTVQGTSTVDAAGGTFRGRNADTAVVFTWTC